MSGLAGSQDPQVEAGTLTARSPSVGCPGTYFTRGRPGGRHPVSPVPQQAPVLVRPESAGDLRRTLSPLDPQMLQCPDRFPPLSRLLFPHLSYFRKHPNPTSQCQLPINIRPFTNCHISSSHRHRLRHPNIHRVIPHCCLPVTWATRLEERPGTRGEAHTPHPHPHPHPCQYNSTA